MSGRGLRLVQHAVMAVAHAQHVLEGLDVDVRGGGFHRAADDLIDQPDNRRLARQILKPFGVVFERRFPRFGLKRLVFLGQQTVQSRFQFDRHGRGDGDPPSGGGGQGGGGETIKRVRERDRH